MVLATCHTSNETMNYLRQFLGKRTISEGLWLSLSPTLTPPDYFLWLILKGRVYYNRPQTPDELKRNITSEINNIRVEILRKVFSNMVKRDRVYLKKQGSHYVH